MNAAYGRITLITPGEEDVFSCAGDGATVRRVKQSQIFLQPQKLGHSCMTSCADCFWQPAIIEGAK